MFGMKFKIRDFVYMFLAGLFVMFVFGIVAYSTSSEKIVIDEHHKEAQKVLDPIDGDFTIGDKDALVQVVFYGDFSCHHCMRFIHENFEKLRDNYIFAGKVQFIFRPVITLKRSLYGSKFLFCDKRSDEDNADIFYGMFENKWMMKQDYLNGLLTLATKKNWTTTEHFQQCVSSKQMEKNLHKLYQETVEKLQIHSTPHVFINYKPTNADKSIFDYIDKEYNYLKKRQSQREIG